MCPVPIRCSFRRTLAICSHISGDTEKQKNNAQPCQQGARAASCSKHSLMSVCAHSLLLFFFSLSFSLLPAPPFRSGAASAGTPLRQSSAAPEAGGSCSALACASGWHGGWVCADVAALLACSTRVVCLLLLCAPESAASHSTSDATAAGRVLRLPLHGAQQVRKRNEKRNGECTRGGCCASAPELDASWLQWREAEAGSAKRECVFVHVRNRKFLRH